MAGAHRKKSMARNKRHNRNGGRRGLEPFTWLGAGAITLGVGAALASGSAVAHADSTGSDGSSPSGASAHESAKKQTNTGTSHRQAAKPTGKIESATVRSSGKTVTVHRDSTSVTPVASNSSLTPAPAAPVDPIAPVVAAISGAARDVEAADNHRKVPVSPTTTVGDDTSAQESFAAVPKAAIASADDGTQTETQREVADADFNLSQGWIPGLGTIHNALSLVQDVAELSSAVLSGNVADITDEFGDIAIDVIGMVPVVGGPLAGTLRNAVIAASDKAPSPTDDGYVIDEDTQVTGNVLVNDTDADGDPLTAAIKTQPAHGAVTFNTDGTFTYTPTANYNGTDAFTYAVSDGQRNTTGTVTVTITPVADAPVAGDDTATLNEDTSKVISLLGNDSDADHDPLTITDLTNPEHGTAVLSQDGTLTYTPVANYNGTDSVVYTISDGTGATTTATVSITVTAVADPPTAVDDGYTVDEDTQLTGNVLVNDSDADDDTLTAAIGTQTTHGVVTLNADGSFAYTPTADYNGTDVFTYTASDGVQTTTATVNFTVNSVNDAPVAGDDSATLDEDTSTVISPLGNDTDVENDPLTVVDAAAGHGSASVGTDGTITYTPSANYNGTDTVVYTVSDGLGGTTPGTISVTVNPIGDAPVAANDGFGVNQDTQLTGNVLSNDYDPDGDSLSVSLNGGAAHGNVSLNADGSFTYNPSGGYSGGDSFSYTLTDSTGATAVGTVNVTVNYVAPPPPPPPSEPTSTDKINAFYNEWNGRTVAGYSSPSVDPGQCVALIDQYVSEKYGINLTQLNAVRYADGQTNGNILKANGWQWHGGGAAASSIPEGAILVFGQNSQAQTGSAGHIGIWHNGAVFDQNDGWRSNGAKAGLTSYSHIAPALLGYWSPPGGSTGGGGGGGGTTGTSGTKSGTATVRVLVNVRNDPSTNGPIIAQYTPGQTFNYDSWVIGNGFYWVSYVSFSGTRRYVAEATQDGSTVYLSGGVFH
jgi:VCBS repeat-containing protein